MRHNLRPGSIVEYPYLWRWQRERGETEGRKDRPVCVLVAVHGDGDLTHLVLLAISSGSPASADGALEVPETERRRGGLHEWKRAWITISEYNYDIAERSWYLDSNQTPRGRFSKSFMMALAKAAAPLFRSRTSRVDRVE